MINHRFKTKATPQEDAFARLSEGGMLSALLDAEGVDSYLIDNWPDNLSKNKSDIIYEDYLSAVCWLEYIINPESTGSLLPRSKYLGKWIQQFEWGLLPYARQLDYRFKFLHAWLINLMDMVGTTSINGCVASEVI